MKTIWKYKLAPEIELEVPTRREFLTVHAQGEDIFLWMKVDTIYYPQYFNKIKIRCFGTGHEMPNDKELSYLGTAFLPNGLVFHVFEEM